MKKFFLVIAVFAMVLAVTGTVYASLSTFESFNTGVSVNGQSGWTVADSWGNQTDFDAISTRSAAA